MSYQATLGRSQMFETYHHANSQIGCIKNYGLSNPYNYNAWSTPRETKTVAPSIYTASKSRLHQQKSFSILLTTAAFILLLAILTVAALAYYISSIKMQVDDSMLTFEGSFQIAKGDIFSTGLKYNHTTTYKQKVEFYKRFLERALSDNGLLPLHTDVWGFGDGPLLKVSFKTTLDLRKWPQNALGVEEFIKESIFLETVAEKSLYRYLRIDSESVEVKRINKDQTAKADFGTNMAAHSEKRIKKVNKNALNLVSKPDTTTKKFIRTTEHSIAESDFLNDEIEKAPVVHGSYEGTFEITKTDADITQTKVMPTKAYSSSLAPKVVTPYFIRVRPKKPAIEKITTKTMQEHTTTRSTTEKSKQETTVPSVTTTTTTTTTTPTSTTTTSTTTPGTTVKISTSSITTKPTPRDPYIATKLFANHADFPGIQQFTTMAPIQSFTSFPVLDTQPWRPIHRDELLPGLPPAFPTQTIYATKAVVPPATESYFNLFAKSKNQINNPIFAYNTFGNMSYQNIERLGAGAQIKPHPLPVSLIDEVVPTFKPLHIKSTEENQMVTDSVETTTTEKLSTTEKSTTTTTISTTIKPTTASTTNKPLFWNMKEVILKRNQAKNSTHHTNTTIIANHKKKPIITLDDSYLFPSQSKWEFVNSSATKNQPTLSNLRRVFNKTLQALVSEDIQQNTENETLNEIKTRINNVTNIQDISLIFDTLASKLGVTPTQPTKLPPVSQHRLKQTKENQTQLITNREKPYFSSTDLPLQQHEDNSSSEGVGAAIPVFGEAEVEDMDPTKYEQLLKSTRFSETSSSETLTELVTLLPARSNSAIRSQPTYAEEIIV